jgi:thiamine biosynthesis lipoprotein
MAELMEEWEVPHALVHGGYSSVLALEAPPGQDGWPLTLTAPGNEGVLARVSARRRAFSASGVRKGDHIQDPRTGRPLQGKATAWVAVAGGASSDADGLSPAAVADALSTAFMILGTEEVAGICRRNPEIEAWLLKEPPDEGQTPGLVHLVAGAPRGGRAGRF